MATAQTAPFVSSKGLRKACLLVCSALALLFLFVSFRTFVHVYDEGFALVGGERVLKGEIPYRDFWTVYPAGQSYALAGVFRLFGTTLGAARLYDILVRFALVVGVFLMGRRIAPVPAAVAAAALITLWLGTGLFYSYAVFPALALASFALLSWMRYAGTGRQRWLAASGALTGAAALFRVDVGLYAGVAIVLAWVFSVLSSPPSPSARPRALLRAAGVFLGCAAAVAVPFYLYLLLGAGAKRIWELLVVFPLTTFRRVRHLPYPRLVPDFKLFFQSPSEYVRWAQFYLPPAIFVISALSIGVSLFKRRAEDEPAARNRTGGALVIAFGGLVFAQALSRYDWIHVLPASIWASLAFAFLVGRVPWEDRRRRPVTVGAAAAALTALAASFLGAHLRPAAQALSDTVRYASPFSCHSEVERAGCAVLSSYQAQAIELVRNVTAPDEPIFVGNHRHDLILFNDAAFYFLAGRPCPTAYHELHPGVATTLEVQQTIARDIERRGVKWIVLAEWPAPSEPNDSSVSSGVRYLDRWIRTRYRPVAVFGNYTIWRVQ
jgi:hypothetical protein